MIKESILTRLNQISKGTFIEKLNLKFTDFDKDSLSAEIIFSNDLTQPEGFLHGGVSLSLAETLGSALSYLNIDNETKIVFGVQINAHHISSVNEGKIIAKARFINKGKLTHIIQIEIFNLSNNKKKKICVAILTTRIIDKIK